MRIRGRSGRAEGRGQREGLAGLLHVEGRGSLRIERWPSQTARAGARRSPRSAPILAILMLQCDKPRHAPSESCSVSSPPLDKLSFLPGVVFLGLLPVPKSRPLENHLFPHVSDTPPHQPSRTAATVSWGLTGCLARMAPKLQSPRELLSFLNGAHPLLVLSFPLPGTPFPLPFGRKCL